MCPLGDRCGVRWNKGGPRTSSVVIALLCVLAVICVARARSSDEDTATALQDGRRLRIVTVSDDAAPPMGRSQHYRRKGSRRKRRPDRYSYNGKKKHSWGRKGEDWNEVSASAWKTKHRVESCNATSLDSLNRSHVESMEELEGVLCQHYEPWSKWRACNHRCVQSRVRRCRRPDKENCWSRKLRDLRPCRGRRRGRERCPSRRDGDSLKWWYRLVDRAFYDMVYSEWSQWSACTRSCSQRRRKRCTLAEVCQNSYVQETRRCGAPGSRCHKRYMLKTKPSNRDDDAADVDVTSSPTKEPGGGGRRKEENSPGRQGGKDEEEEEEEAANKTKDRVQEDTEKTDAILASLHNGTCGERPPAQRGSYRVVGGQEAQRLGWPWQMAILTRWDEQFCAGTLIAPQWVLTAAHCVRKKKRRRRFIVRAGEHDLGAFEGSEDEVKPEVEFPHDDFDYHTITNDIALVRLARPLEPRAHPGYACLPDPGFVPDKDSLCYILGWGKRRNTHLFGADLLHEAQVPLVPHKRCQRVFDYDINNHTQLCAGYKRGGSDACAGDSGGPLLCPKTEGGVTRWYLTGITSYGEGCGRRGKFGIYTNVVSYRDWMANVLRKFQDGLQ